MDLNFTQQPEGWVAEFELTADANLHIERDERGYMEVLQRSPEGGQYARVEGLDAYAFDLVNDLDLTALIYPKFIKVVSAVMPTYAVVTSAGEVTEIKSQTKEIEVTANGTTEVTPDAGFSYLNSVKVKTNVAGSGEGGGGDVYVNFDVPEGITPGELIIELVACMPIIEVAYEDKYLGYTLLQGNTAVIQYCQAPSSYDNATEVIGFHFSGQIMTPDGLVNVLDYLLNNLPLSAKHIREDKFYNTEEK